MQVNSQGKPCENCAKISPFSDKKSSAVRMLLPAGQQKRLYRICTVFSDDLMLLQAETCIGLPS